MKLSQVMVEDTEDVLAAEELASQNVLLLQLLPEEKGQQEAQDDEQENKDLWRHHPGEVRYQITAPTDVLDSPRPSKDSLKTESAHGEHRSFKIKFR